MIAKNSEYDPKKTTQRNARAPRFQRSTRPKSMRLTERDESVLRALLKHRFLSGRQICRLLFDCSESRGRRRLRTLFDQALVERIQLVSQPAKGIPPYVYVLAPAGAARLNDTKVTRGFNSLGNLSFVTLRHRLLINEFYVSLVRACRAKRCQLLTWHHEEALRIVDENGRSVAERIVHDLLPQPMSFLPDGYFELGASSGESFGFFFEMDLATHPHRVWRERALLYSAYADSGAGWFRRRFHRETFRLAIVTTDDYRKRSRRRNILETIEATIGKSDLFLAATLDEMKSNRLLEHIWMQPGAANRVSLLDNPGAQLAK